MRAHRLLREYLPREVPAPVLLWAPRRGILAGPLVGRRPTLTRATARWYCEHGRYYYLPAGRLAPTGEVCGATTGYAYYSMDASQGLTGLTAASLSDGPIVGRTAYRLTEDSSTGGHLRSVSTANLPANYRLTCTWILRAGSRQRFALYVGNDVQSVKAICRWDGGVPVLDSWANVGVTNQTFVKRNLADGWWRVGFTWQVGGLALASPTAQLILRDDSGAESYTGEGATIDVAYMNVEYVFSNSDSEHPQIVETNGSLATINGDYLAEKSTFWDQFWTRPFTMFAVLRRDKPLLQNLGYQYYTLLRLTPNSNTNQVQLSVSNSSTRTCYALCYVNGVNLGQVNLNIPSLLSHRVAAAVSVAGTSVAVSANGAVATGTGTGNWNSYSASGAELQIGHCISYNHATEPLDAVYCWDRALSAGELSILTRSFSRGGVL